VSKSKKGYSSINAFYKGDKMNEERCWGARGPNRQCCAYKAAKYFKKLASRLERRRAKLKCRRKEDTEQ